ncbi:hypothetical protein BJX61DRAFT_54074 [Aspergillus egyptiacus]|nr:hypothetical protein BJX61DRAFT_54074 [Aspergillus egyptiacus]
MSTTSVLGESWVVTPAHTEKGSAASNDPLRPSKQTSRSRTEDGGRHGSQSLTASSTSSMSGPELIMPSIYEAPISEASWVSPTVRRKDSNSSLRRRHQSSTEPAKAEKGPSVTLNEGAHSTRETNVHTRPQIKFLETSIRTLVNIFLLAAISHLLILPELVQQYQIMCSIGPITALYPSSCVPLYPKPFKHHQHHRSAPLEPAVSSQTRLENLFNGTLHKMAPLNGSLKQTEAQLRIVEKELKQTHPGTKHELDLEFESCWRAIRVAAWKFDSLKVDIQSALDSLVAAGDVKPKAASSDSASSIAHDTRLSTQMIRREQYLDQLTERMRSKADSLAADLATLDDHLESIEAIVTRETGQTNSATYHPKNMPLGSSNRLSAFVDAIIPPSITLPSFLRPLEGGNDGNGNTDLTLSQIFHEATTHHRPVAQIARTLSKQLQQFVQSKRNVPH